MITTDNFLALNNVFKWFQENVQTVKISKLMLKYLCEEDKIKHFKVGNRYMISLESCLSFFNATDNPKSPSKTKTTGKIKHGDNN